MKLYSLLGTYPSVGVFDGKSDDVEHVLRGVEVYDQITLYSLMETHDHTTVS